MLTFVMLLLRCNERTPLVPTAPAQSMQPNRLSYKFMVLIKGQHRRRRRQPSVSSVGVARQSQSPRRFRKSTQELALRGDVAALRLKATPNRPFASVSCVLIRIGAHFL